MNRFSLAVLVLVSLVGCRATDDGARTISCMPGELVEIGCAAGCGIGSCTGDATLRFCDGTLSPNDCAHTSDGTMFVSIDDSSCGGLCPFGRVACPASGSITVVPGALGSSRADCHWGSNNLGTPRGAEIVSCTPGTPMQIGCSDTCGIGHCAEGSARLRICDGVVTTGDCASGSGTALGHWMLSVTDSSGGSGCDTRCPEAVVSCPASGLITVSPSALSTTTRDFFCQWEAVEAPHRDDGMVSCTPGTRVVVGCAAGCHVGACLGEGGIRVCDGGLTAAQCEASSASNLAQAYGSSSCDTHCPETVVTCPASGAITVISRASFSSSSPEQGFGCNWAVRPAGIGE